MFIAGADLYYQLPADVDNFVAGGASASVPSEKLAFSFSGMRSSLGGSLDLYGTNLKTSNSMIKVSMDPPGNATWEEKPLPEGILGRASGQLLWIPVSTQGILLAVGGVLYPPELFAWSLTTEQETENEENNPSFMASIPVYDIASDNWYSQTTEGENPGQLVSFCAVVAHAPTDDSYDIFIYGGDNGLTLSRAKNAQDTVWVLSVPSFTWTKVDKGVAGHGRSGHSCSMPWPDQMLVFGGWNLDQAGFCIKDGSAIDVFNLKDLEWTKKYEPRSGKNYTASTEINKPKRPINPDIQALFDQPYDQSKIMNWYPYKEGSRSKKSTPIAAIAGGAGGGATAIIVAFLVWYFWPSRRQKRRARRQSDTGTTSTLRNGRVSRWLPGVYRPSTDVPVIPKDLASESTTDVDPQMSPPAEVHGDYEYYFRPAPHVSPARSPAAEISSHPSSSPRRISYLSAHPPRSPAANSVEHDGEEVHEKDGVVRTSQMSDLGQGPVDFRQHPQYPYSIDRVASSDNNSNSGVHSHRHGALGSHVRHLSSHGRQHSNTAPSPTATPTSLREVDNANANANEKAADTIHPLRPTHQRNASSMSSTLPITPPETGNDRPPLEMRMSANSAGPVSPLLHVERSTSPIDRPPTHRHGSSGFSGLSGESHNIALPPPAHPMSPSSMYSPTSAGQGNGTGSSARTEARRVDEEATGGSGEATLVGNGPSPMTEKNNPLAAMAASLQSPSTPSSAATRRKPVGGQRPPAGLGLNKSAYEENGGSDGRQRR